MTADPEDWVGSAIALDAEADASIPVPSPSIDPEGDAVGMVTGTP